MIIQWDPIYLHNLLIPNKVVLWGWYTLQHQTSVIWQRGRPHFPFHARRPTP